MPIAAARTPLRTVHLPATLGGMAASVTLHAVDAGGPRALPIVFLHGFLGDAADWAGVVSALGSRHRCVAVDLPGHGRSLGLPPEAYTLDGAAAGVLHTLAARGISHATLVGYSLGGRLALRLALESPSNWNWVIIEAASPGIEAEADRAARRTSDATWAARLETTPFDDWLRQWYAQPVFATLRRDSRRFEAMLARRCRGNASELARALRGMSVGRQACLWPALPSLAMPIGLVAGADDDQYCAITERMRCLCPDARVAIVSGAGHNVHLEDPGTFTTTLQSWLGAK